MNTERKDYIVQTYFSKTYVLRNRPTLLWTTNDPQEAQRFTEVEALQVAEECGGRVLLAAGVVDYDADEVVK